LHGLAKPQVRLFRRLLIRALAVSFLLSRTLVVPRSIGSWKKFYSPEEYTNNQQ
jgi:hypothetical protein